MFLTVVFSSTLKSLEKCSIHWLGEIVSTEWWCCQKCFGLFVKVSTFFILFSSHFCFWILIAYLYFFPIFWKWLLMFMFFWFFCKRLEACLNSFFKLTQVSLYQDLLRFLFVLYWRFNFRLLLAQFVMKSVNVLVAFCRFWTLSFLSSTSDIVVIGVCFESNSGGRIFKFSTFWWIEFSANK